MDNYLRAPLYELKLVNALSCTQLHSLHYIVCTNYYLKFRLIKNSLNLDYYWLFIITQYIYSQLYRIEQSGNCNIYFIYFSILTKFWWPVCGPIYHWQCMPFADELDIVGRSALWTTLTIVGRNTLWKTLTIVGRITLWATLSIVGCNLAYWVISTNPMKYVQ